MKRSRTWRGGLVMGLVVAALGAAGCDDDATPAGATGTGGASATGTGGGSAGGTGGTGGAGGSTQTLYQKYGTAIPKVVDDAVAGVLADCEIAPYFAVVGSPGHDSVARLKSCLRLQFTALFGGPATYPGVNDQGDTCADMTSIHAGLGIPGPVFDKFIMDFGAVLKADGVADADIGTIATAVIGLKSQIVSPTPVTASSCDGGVGH